MTIKSSGEKKKSVRILIVDDHAVVRQGLRRLIEAEGRFEVKEAADAHSALEVLKSFRPEVSIVDLGLQEMNGIELIKNLKLRDNRIKILVVSMYDESVYAERSLRAGARGYIMKKESAEKVVQALQRVLEGRIYLSEKMSEKLLGKLCESDSSQSTPVESLSDRELEVFQLIGQGCKTGEIANRLSLSVKTIESYREQIKTKLNLQNSSELARYAIEWIHKPTG